MRKVLARALSVAIGAVVLMIASPSYSQNSVILGCIKKNSGDIRIVSDAEQCKSNKRRCRGIRRASRAHKASRYQASRALMSAVLHRAFAVIPIPTPTSSSVCHDYGGFDTGLTIANDCRSFHTNLSAGSCVELL